jgi:hypothetical protein
MRIRPRLSWALPAMLTYGVAAAIGCAGAGTTSTGGGGSSSPGSGGNGGSSSQGSGGTTGVGGTSSPGAAGSSSAGTGGSTGAVGGTGGSSRGGTTGSAGVGGTVGSGGTTGSGGTGGICQMAEYTFDPKIPSVYVLVDRSGTEFTSDTTGIFFTLRAAVLQVIQPLQDAVRFGLGVFTGEGGMCPIMDTVPIALKNYDAIAAKYNMLGKPNFKAETPASLAIPMAQAALNADAGTGDKYLLFVTDSQTDFCDDGSAVCPSDAVTYQLQTIYAATPRINTLIIGLPTNMGTNISAASLQNFANAGTGQPVTYADPNAPNAGQVYNQCNGNAGWQALWTAAGKAMGVPLATYSATGGNATVFAPTSTSQSALVTQISAALAGVKSCSFDLTNVNGKSIKVDTTKLNQAHVLIQGNEIPLSTTNGWTVDPSAPTTLVLSGDACTTWRMPNVKTVDFQFPCGTIIFE